MDPAPDEGSPERQTEERLSFSFCDDPTVKSTLQHLKHKLTEDSVQTIELELEFLSIFVKYTANRCFEYQNSADLQMRAKALDRRAARVLKLIRKNMFISYFWPTVKTTFYNIAAYVEVEVKLMRSEIREVYRIVSWSSQSHHFISNGLVIDFIGSLMENLKDLLCFKVDLDDSLKIKLKALKENLHFLRNFLMFTEKRCTESEELNNLFTHAKFAADNAAYLSYSCSVDDMDEQMVDRLVSDLSILVQKLYPLTPKGPRQIYIAVLGVSSVSTLRPDLNNEIAVDFVDSVLKNVMELVSDSRLPFKDEIEILQEDLTFLRSFLMDLPNLNTETQTLSDLVTQSRVISLVAGSVVHSLYYRGKNYEAPEGVGSTLANLLEEIKSIKVKITKICPKSPFPKFPSTDELGFLDCFLGNLRELSNDRIVSTRGLNLRVEQLLEELQFLRSFLGKIAKRHTGQEELKVLWTQIIDVAYKAEYMIDSLLVKNGPEEYRMFWLSEITKEIKVLTAKVNQIDEKKMHDSEVNHSAKIYSQLPPQATSPEMDEVVVGFEDVEKNIIEDLTGGSTKQQMVAIVGMPGQGKTHLAKIIYNNPIVKDYFYVRAWCYVSPVYSRKHLLTHILCQVVKPNEEMQKKTDEEVAELLYKSLKGNKYLILMDDLWDVEAWDALKKSFPDDNNGSRITFTSRFLNLDLKGSGSKIHRLRPFSDNESWQLLQGKLFQSESCPSELLKVGKQIAKNCNGLPLAIVVIAGILARIDKKEHYWREVANSQSSYIVDDLVKQPMKVIDLSYKHLPDYLKSCFLYIGAFIDNNYIPVQKLIRLWVAEGFIHKVEKKSLENIAEDYLIDLIDRSLIIITKRRSTGDIKVCRVHDLVRDFCLEKAKEDNFLQLIKQVRTSHLPTPVICEQLRISSNQPELFFPSKAYGPHIRSLLLFGFASHFSKTNCYVSYVCHKFKLLRVLDLECIEIWSYFLDTINSLAHLRYLAISGNFDSIPSSIANLWNLETFIFKGSRRYVLLDTIWNMLKLRHLHINPMAILRGPSSDCVSRLDNLQTISTLEMRYLNQDEKKEVMKGLAYVRSLRCIFVDSSYSGLATLSQLESLWMSYSGFGRWHGEFNLPSNLKKLTISEFRLPWKKISILGKLPNLEVLKLLDKAFEGEEWEIREGEFPKLKFLKLKILDISKWSVSSDDFPPLEQLVLQNCPQLKEIPDCLVDIPTLKSIEVSRCNSPLEEFAKQIQEEQLDFGNHELKVVVKHNKAKSFVSNLNSFTF